MGIKLKKLAWGFLGAALCLVAVPAGATNINLGTAGAFSAFVLHDLTLTGGQSVGALATGGDAKLTNYRAGVGSKPSDVSLVVGGDLQSNNAPVAGGQVLVGGEAQLPSWLNRGNIKTGVSNLPVDFAADSSYLTDLSQTLSLLETTGTVNYTNWGINATGDGSSDLQVFNLDPSQMNRSNYWNALSSIPNDAHIIFNVSGTDINMSGSQQALTDWSDKVIFNFYEAERLSLHNMTVEGSILAPMADVLTSGITINGNLVSKSLSGPLYTTGQQFSPYSGGGTAAAPEPGTLFLLAGALGGVAGFSRLRLRRRGC